MSNDMRLQCSCSAFFPTGDAFRAHLDEYRTLEGYLSAQLKIYRSHSKVNSDDPDSDGHDPDVYEDAEGPGIKHNCPFKGCNRNESFKTRQRLRRHFEQHVKCEEVCVCCQHVSRRARDYIRHAERHQDVGMIKTTYIKQMCDELRKRAADELDLAERLSDVERGNKRAREVGDVGSRTSGVQRAKLQRVGATNELDFQPANDAQTAVAFTQSATALMPPSNVAEHEPRAGFPNTSTEVYYPTSIEGPASALDDIDFDAPIFSIINWPGQFTGWTQTENMAGNIGSGMP
ncbi:hypothetical protein BKA64DRAFT_685939 [Cadophora sp. MPI-SDFR-AT-0126]|nr:hypothetical protein BKA64DRAFT_685939 [Leotiomycetes sp. MPI-SDFR-AT-0126]